MKMNLSEVIKRADLLSIDGELVPTSHIKMSKYLDCELEITPWLHSSEKEKQFTEKELVPGRYYKVDEVLEGQRLYTVFWY